MDELINSFMKIFKYLFTALLLLCTTVATAHDFEVGGVYYNITDATNKTVEVTYKGDNSSSYVNEYSGSVVIPESVTYSGTIYSVTSIGYRAFSGCSNLTNVEISNSVISIGNYAFSSCSTLTGIEIPNSISSIGDFSFFNCSDLVGVEIPNSVISIGNNAFSGCSSLTSIEIPNSVTSIGDYGFYACSGLTAIIIGNGVTAIGYEAFEYCSDLKTIINLSYLTFSVGSLGNGGIAYYADKVFNAPDGFIDGDFVWYENEDGVYLAGYLGDATELTLPTDYNGKSIIGIGDYAFKNCPGLIGDVVIPNSVTSIGYKTFEECANIENLHIGNSIESIGDYAFAGCESIKEIKTGLQRPVCGSANIFADAVYDSAVLYVPYGTKSLYQEVEPWSLFYDIVEEMDLTGIDEVNGGDGKMKTIYYDLNGRAVENPVSGVYIVNGKKVFVK